MKKELATTAAFVVQLDELILELENSAPDQRPALLELANNFINHAYKLLQDGNLPAHLIADLVQVQRQLIIEVVRHRGGT